MRGHSPITVREFLGRFNRGRNDSVPFNHAVQELNNQFTHGGVETRPGTVLSQSIAWKPVRMHRFPLIGANDRILALKNTGDLYDLAVSSTVAILSIATMTDFSCVVLGNRAYITPHNGSTGIDNEFIYVYTGSGTARKAAGIRPDTALSSVTSTNTGVVETGYYVAAVAFEYESGFISPPHTVANRVTFQVTLANKKLTFAGIDTGGTGVVARRLLVSKKSTAAITGDVGTYELYFIPTGRIADNVTTSLEVNFYNTDLVSSADYLEDLLEELPACLGLIEYSGRMVGWGEYDTPSLLRGSLPGDYESWDSAVGYKNVTPQDSSSSIKCCVEFGGNLNIHKDHKSVTTRDNGGDVIDWKIIDLDGSIGSPSVFGVGEVLDVPGSTVDHYLLVSKPGLMLFDGVFGDRPLTWKIKDDWDSISWGQAKYIQVKIDAIGKKIYIAAPLVSGVDQSHWFVGDYSDGLNPDAIKWSKWQFGLGHRTTSVVLQMDNTTKTPIVKFASQYDNGVWTFQADTYSDFDAANAIQWYYQFPYFPDSEEGGIYHFNGIRVRAHGNGTLGISVYGEDENTIGSHTGLTLSSTLGKRQLERIFIGVQEERASIRLHTNTVAHYCKIDRFRMFARFLWMSRPQ